MDPEIPAVRRRAGWRGVDEGIDGSENSWRNLLINVATRVSREFSDQLSWRFENLQKFKWMEIIHPMEFERMKKMTPNIEDADEFEAADQSEVDLEAVITGKPSIQDSLNVIKWAELQDALPQAMKVLELAAVTPLTSVHCKRVFSGMKRVVSATRSRMLQKRKEMLLLLLVEQKILRGLSEQPHFKPNIIARFKSFNQRRMDRFSRK